MDEPSVNEKRMVAMRIEETNDTKMNALIKAEAFVTRIVSQHGLQDYRSGAPFGHGMTVSKSDQHIDLIIRVANWLLGKED